MRSNPGIRFQWLIALPFGLLRMFLCHLVPVSFSSIADVPHPSKSPNEPGKRSQQTTVDGYCCRLQIQSTSSILLLTA